MAMNQIVIGTTDTLTRRCGGCTACCKLLPTHTEDPRRITDLTVRMVEQGWMTVGEALMMRPDFDKPAGVRCPHQRSGKGCGIYETRPFCCRMWNCRWLVSDDTADLRRPDRAGYVIDISPDVVRMAPEGNPIDVQVVQVWIDPARPDAWETDKELRAYMLRRAQDRIATMIRYDSRNSFVIFPPPIFSDGEWHDSRELNSRMMERQGHDLNPDNWTEGA